MTRWPSTPTIVAHKKRGKVKEVVYQGFLCPTQSKIKEVVVSNIVSIEANLIPEKFKPWLGDNLNLASTKKILHSTLTKNLNQTILPIFGVPSSQNTHT